MARRLFMSPVEGTMALAAPLVPRDTTQPPREPVTVRPERTPRFEDLVFSGAPRRSGHGGLTALASLFIHGVLVAVVVIVPVLSYDFLPDPDQAVRAFFVTPAGVALPPPPPPPPAAGARVTPLAPVAPRAEIDAKFLAPIEVPDEVKPEEGLDLGVPGGVPGGVEGGVPGGVVGGIVGGLLEAPPPPPTRVVRVGGQIKAPKVIQRVDPEYPQLARSARVKGIVIIEAWVGEDGRVKSTKLLRGVPLLDEAALAAVKQWRYQPLLLNGQPTEFMLTVTVQFSITQEDRP